MKELKEGTASKRVGLTTTGRPARTGAPIFDASGKQVGAVTSGVPSPTLGKNVAMGYVPAALAPIGTKLQVQVGAKLQPAEIVKVPFVPTRYHKVN